MTATFNSTADYADFADINLTKQSSFPIRFIRVIRGSESLAGMTAIRAVSKSFDQLIISLVAADPKPLEKIAALSGERPIMISDANAPDVLAQRHELERRVTGLSKSS